jgi:hypothetical protein
MSAAHAKTRLEVARAELERVERAKHHGHVIPHQASRVPNTVSSAMAWSEIIAVLTSIHLDVCPHCGSQRHERRPLPRGPPITATEQAA